MTNLNETRGERNSTKVFLFADKCLNVFLMSLPFYLAWHGFYASKIATPFLLRGTLLIFGLYAFLYALLANLYDGYSVSFSSASELVYSQTLSAALSDCILFAVILLLVRRFVSVWPFLLVLCAQTLLSALWSWLTRKVYCSVNPPLRTVLIGEEAQNAELSKELKRAENRFQLTAAISISEYLREPARYLEEADAVFLTEIHSPERAKVIRACADRRLSLYLIPNVGDALLISAKSAHLFYRPLLETNVYDPSLFYLFVKRCTDIVISLGELLVLSPLMGLVALLIRRDGGPAFYKQVRLTKDGKPFEVLKFRSMTVNAESDGVARLSTGQNDSRVTPVGRVIRRFRIDELPQLLNVLRGEMSIVGPRPERPELTKEYEKTVPEFSLRLRAKAGLTGYAQVYGKYNTEPYEKLLLDLQYMARPGMLNDLKIILATVKVLFIPESTEGVDAQRTPPDSSVSEEAPENKDIEQRLSAAQEDSGS